MDKKDWIQWNVRLAVPGEEFKIAKLALPYETMVNPYVLHPRQVAAYLDEWIVAENPDSGELGGALHFVTNDPYKPGFERNISYLKYMKQVNPTVIQNFINSPGAVFKSQPTCPGKGTLKAVSDWLKDNYDEIWLWISLASSLLEFHEKDNMNIDKSKVYRFMNVYKGDYSNFVLGIWKRGDK